MNAWRELLARIFADIPAQENVSPEWLVNPTTRRKLKLDLYYQDVGFAVRFVGLTAKGASRRRSDWEVLEEEQRDQTRVEICRLHDVQLWLVNLLDDPLKQVDQLIRLLARCCRVLAQGKRPDRHKNDWMPQLATAQTKASDLRSRIARSPDQMMTNLAESWRDRETGRALATMTPDRPAAGTHSPVQKSESKQSRSKKNALRRLGTGKRVQHERFGSGVVTGLNGEGEEATVSVLFDGEQERTFLLELVQDKLTLE